MDMEAGNRMETSDFVVGKGMEAHEADNDEEISEICLAPDLEAEDARKQELQLQAQKVEYLNHVLIFILKLSSADDTSQIMNMFCTGICLLDELLDPNDYVNKTSDL